MREHLAATEKRLADADRASKVAAEQHRQEQAALQTRLDAAESKLAEAITQHAAELQGLRTQHAGEMKELKAQHSRNESDLKKRLDEAGKISSAELKARQTALDKAAEARETKASMAGEFRARKSHNEQLAVSLSGKVEPVEVKAKK